MLSSVIKAGVNAQEFLKAITEKGVTKNSNFVMVFSTLKMWIESDNPEIKLTQAEKSLLFTVLPYVNFNNQIELLQADIQQKCGYKSRRYFTSILSSLEKKRILEKVSVGRQNYWFFNSLLVKKGNPVVRKNHIKFNFD